MSSKGKLKGKLQRYKEHFTLDKQPEHAGEGALDKQTEISVEASSPGKNQRLEREWLALGAKPLYYEEQYTMARELRLPISTAIGTHSLDKLYHVIDLWNRKRSSHPLSSKNLEAGDLFFFDTETTGLGGGAGNTIFLLGYSRVVGDQLLVKQLLLPNPAYEVAMYHYFLEDLQGMKRLVTYNGKAFDWPQVKTRHTLIRNELPKLPQFGHYDLLHAARRFWKSSLPSCRLSIVEEQVLRFQRQGDTPGYLAPILYFDYLREERPTILEGVLQHNQWDVCSLITLYIHISYLLLQEGSIPISEKEKYEVARWYEAIGELAEAQLHYERLIQETTGLHQPATMALAAIYKKEKKYEQARKCWELVSADSSYSYEADIELAKLFEHQYKDVEKALHYVLKAYDIWRESRRAVRYPSYKKEQEKREIMKRMERLEQKLYYA